jgi:hypothetical protein
LGRISTCSGEMIHSISLFRQRVNARRTMNDNDKPRAICPLRPANISCSHPSLTSIWTAYASPALSSFLDPPIELTGFRLRGRLHLDRWLDLAVICLSVGLFDMYAGPWSRRFDDSTFVKLLISYLPVTGVTALAAWRLWRGSRRGTVMSVALLPVEAV